MHDYKSVKRKKDKRHRWKHLGGSDGVTWIDEKTLDYLIDTYKISTMVDVGCGIGDQVRLALSKGIIAFGIDGDPTFDFYDGTIFIKHDYVEGPLKIPHCEMCWCVEFLEHVESKFIDNFFSTFLCCDFVCCTHALPGKAGYHHVNCQESIYWIRIFDKYGFRLLDDDTRNIKKISDMRFMVNTGMLFGKK